MDKEPGFSSTGCSASEHSLANSRTRTLAEGTVRSAEESLHSVKWQQRSLYILGSVGMIAILLLLFLGGSRPLILWITLTLLFLGQKIIILNHLRRCTERVVTESRGTLTAVKESEELLKPFWEEENRKNTTLRQLARELVLEIKKYREGLSKDLPLADTRQALGTEIERRQIVYDERVRALCGNVPPPRDHFLDALKSNLGLTRFGYSVDSTT